ncbi:uncharacterized protein AMSG_08667 [Thecamonas trahens ATCC 50062]|uniref:Fungal lipase-type domain-containing protein n=1 Tax=Thecamonas trahens ATCC 50062 TaxID=461836 RepID=A0A0L0DKL8_THETB|nr:hypothetical protein AMSG_08667 [Thecamonas trahens ATCC 50062]KNC52780.1 hypothetical protein AMSG_08667 [Thecamonas trahens ATCC 50062]|eukprot:XP_013755092.1 hypothetical protein AMSG_08667 [Thecamonas trahens ATCC 50062]
MTRLNEDEARELVIQTAQSTLAAVHPVSGFIGALDGVRRIAVQGVELWQAGVQRHVPLLVNASFVRRELGEWRTHALRWSVLGLALASGLDDVAARNESLRSVMSQLASEDVLLLFVSLMEDDATAFTLDKLIASTAEFTVFWSSVKRGVEATEALCSVLEETMSDVVMLAVDALDEFAAQLNGWVSASMNAEQHGRALKPRLDLDSFSDAVKTGMQRLLTLAAAACDASGTFGCDLSLPAAYAALSCYVPPWLIKDGAAILAMVEENVASFAGGASVDAFAFRQLVAAARATRLQHETLGDDVGLALPEMRYVLDAAHVTMDGRSPGFLLLHRERGDDGNGKVVVLAFVLTNELTTGLAMLNSATATIRPPGSDAEYLVQAALHEMVCGMVPLLRSELERANLLDEEGEEPVTLFVTGHGIAGGVAQIVALVLEARLYDLHLAHHVKLVSASFGAPAVMRRIGADETKSCLKRHVSVVNECDAVPRLLVEGSMMRSVLSKLASSTEERELQVFGVFDAQVQEYDMTGSILLLTRESSAGHA